MQYRLSNDEQHPVITVCEDVQCREHLHRGIEIVVVKEGCLQILAANGEYDIPAGHAAFFEPYEMHGYRTKEHNVCAIFEFSPEFVPHFRDFLLSNTAKAPIICLQEDSSRYVWSRIPQAERSVPDISCAQALLSVLICDFRTLCEFHEQGEKQRDVFLRALDLISAELDQPLTLTSVAKQIGIRPETLSRMFSACSRYTFLEYVQYMRIHRASLLLNSGCNCTEAASRSGFGSICSFNRVFRKLMGCTPTEYAKREQAVSIPTIL